MNDPKKKKIKVKPVKITGPQPKPSPAYFQVPVIADDVGPGDTVEILIPSEKGFTVYFPYSGHFNAQVFEAVENPEWAEEEMAAAAGGGGESPLPLWGVRMTRTSGIGAWPQKVFPFAIFSKDFQNFAVGQSPPKMNLHP